MYLSRRAALSYLVCAVTAALTLASSNELFNHRREVVSDTPGVASEELLSYKDSGDVTPRTATGGIINTLLVLLTIVSFIGNGAFLVCRRQGHAQNKRVIAVFSICSAITIYDL